MAVLASHVSESAVNHGSLPARLAFSGRLGVFLFFTLTGYLLFWPFARRSFGDGRPIAIGHYARNRALRILPLYFVVLATLLVVEHHGGSLTQWLRFGTFTQWFSADTRNTVNSPMWSLCVEVQFYLLLPFLSWGLARLARGSRGIAAAILIALGAISFTATLIRGGDYLNWEFVFVTTFFNFVPGMLLALMRPELAGRSARRLPASSILIGLGFACWLGLPLWLSHTFDQPVAALASFLILAGVVLSAAPGLLVRVLRWRVLGILGLASYSLYLWHEPIVLSLARNTDAGFRGLMVAAFAICIAVSLVSYALVERPFLLVRRRWGSTVASQS